MRLDDDLKYFESPEFKKILESYESAMAEGSSIYMDADELTDLAEYYAMVVHDDNQASDAINLALQLHPDAVDPQIFLARQAMLKEDHKRALKLCNAIPDQSHREVFFLRAELMVREGKNKRARSYLLECAEQVTEDLDYFLFDSAYIFIDYNDYLSARSFAEELERMAPNWFKTWELWADVSLGMEDNNKALECIEKMLDKDPFYISAWNWRTEAYCGLYDYTRAFESTEFALAVDPNNERALELKAWVLMRQENFEQAHEYYTQLQTLNPNSEIHCLYDSYCLFDLQRIDDSLLLIQRAEELAEGLSPEQAAIYEHHAHILSEQGHIKEALHYIDLAEQAYVQDDDYANLDETKKQDFDYYRARIHADNGDSEAAINFIERIAQKGREPLPTVIFQGAEILFEAGDYATALDIFQILNQYEVEQQLLVRTYPYLAACYHECDDHERCLDNIRLAIDNNSPQMFEILGYLFADGVQPAEYYDYYHYRIYGCWPQHQ